MALNLFSKTLNAHTESSGTSSSQMPKFLFCEQSDANAERFMDAVKQKGGSELAGRVERAATPRECVCPLSSEYLSPFGLADLQTDHRSFE